MERNVKVMLDVLLFTVCAFQETILSLHDEREAYRDGDLLHPEEQRYNRASTFRAQHTKASCVSYSFFNKKNYKTVEVLVKCPPQEVSPRTAENYSCISG